MEGLLDCLLRDILTRVGGIDHCVTEFVRVSGSRLPERTFLHIAPELLNDSKTPSGVPVSVQLLGSDPAMMAANAARLATLKPRAIDLNFGCPAKTVNRHGGGAVLLKDPKILFDLVSSVRAAVPADIPVTAKMRLGYEDKSRFLECAKALEEGGAAEIVVHARTKEEGYKPPAHWEYIALIKDMVRVPVIANGEIWTVDDYRRCREVSGCDDVMLGRGIVANPSLALEIRDGERLPWIELMPLLFDFWRLVEGHTLAKYRCGRLKQFLNYLRRTYPEAETAFTHLRTISDPVELERAFFAEFL